MTKKRPVIVIRLPEKLVMGQARLFLREIEAFLKADRPRLVFDFSAVSQVDAAGVEMLLNSMEEVMKRNGDLKLAAVPAGPADILKLTRVDSLFEIFDNTSDAVESFHQVLPYSFPAALPWNEAPVPESESTL